MYRCGLVVETLSSISTTPSTAASPAATCDEAAAAPGCTAAFGPLNVDILAGDRLFVGGGLVLTGGGGVGPDDEFPEIFAGEDGCPSGCGGVSNENISVVSITNSETGDVRMEFGTDGFQASSAAGSGGDCGGSGVSGSWTFSDDLSKTDRLDIQAMLGLTPPSASSSSTDVGVNANGISSSPIMFYTPSGGCSDASVESSSGSVSSLSITSTVDATQGKKKAGAAAGDGAWTISSEVTPERRAAILALIGGSSVVGADPSAAVYAASPLEATPATVVVPSSAVGDGVEDAGGLAGSGWKISANLSEEKRKQLLGLIGGAPEGP